MGEALEFRPRAQRRPMIIGVQHLIVVENVPDETEDLSSRPNLQLIDGHNTAEQFDVMNEVIESTRGAKFWRLDKGLDLIPYPDTDVFRLDQLTAAYNRIEGLTDREEELRKKWKKRPYISTIEQRMAQKINLGKGMGDYPAIELFDDPSVNHHLLSELEELGDPRLAVISAFEKWRVEKAKEEPEHLRVSEEDLNRCYRAFELFLFGAGAGYFTQKLKEVAQVHFIPDKNDIA